MSREKTVFKDVKFTGDLHGRGSVTVSPGRLIVCKGGFPIVLTVPLVLGLLFGGGFLSTWLMGGDDMWVVFIGLLPGIILFHVLWARRPVDLTFDSENHEAFPPFLGQAEREKDLLKSQGVMSGSGEFDEAEAVEVLKRVYGDPPQRSPLHPVTDTVRAFKTLFAMRRFTREDGTYDVEGIKRYFEEQPHDPADEHPLSRGDLLSTLHFHPRKVRSPLSSGLDSKMVDFFTLHFKRYMDAEKVHNTFTRGGGISEHLSG